MRAYLLLIVVLITLYSQSAKCRIVANVTNDKSTEIYDMMTAFNLVEYAFRTHGKTKTKKTCSSNNFYLTIITLAGGRCLKDLKNGFNTHCYERDSHVYTTCGIGQDDNFTNCFLYLTKK